MKRNVSATIFVLIYLSVFVLSFISAYFEENDININPNDYARITDVDYRAEVTDTPNGNGKIVVTERITFDIHAASASNPFRELWRDLPEDYIDGVKTSYKVNYVKEILSNGSVKNYTESPKLYWDDSDYISPRYGPGKWFYSPGPYNEEAGDYEAVMIYVDKYREKPTFEIQYEMENAALRYKDCSELYLCMYSESSIKYLKSFKGQILFPKNLMPDEGNYFAHTYGTDFNSFDFAKSTTLNPGYTTFYFDLSQADLKFHPYNQYIEFSLVSYGDDKHKFTKYASKNDYYYKDVLEDTIKEHEKYEQLPEVYYHKKQIGFAICIVLSLFLILKAKGINKKIQSKYTFFEPEVNYDYFRDIPSNLDPIFASKLVFCKDKSSKEIEDEYASILLSLARKGYIELEKVSPTEDWKINNVKLVIKYQPEPVSTTIFAHTSDDKTDPIQTNVSTNMSFSSMLSYRIEKKDEANPISTPDVEENNSNSDINSETISNIEETVQTPHKELEPLTTSERIYFNLVNRYCTNNEITLKALQTKLATDIENSDSFVTSINNVPVNVGVSGNYFQKANYKEPRNKLTGTAVFYIILGLLSLTLVNFISHLTRFDYMFGGFTIIGIIFILCGIYIKKQAHKYILLSQFGENEYSKWRGLYNFLNSETLINERTVVELPLWEQYLVYATAFGISDKVIKAINIRCPNINDSALLSNPYYRNHSFYTHTRAIRTSTHRASSIARSGGYGGHGGYGGGGRGGGGGGGGH